VPVAQLEPSLARLTDFLSKKAILTIISAVLNCVRWGPISCAPPPEKVAQPPRFGPCLLCCDPGLAGCSFHFLLHFFPEENM